jgi:hypothetical protein
MSIELFKIGWSKNLDKSIREKLIENFIDLVIGHNWRATKSTPAFVGSQTTANVGLSGSSTADVGLSGPSTADVGPVDGRRRVVGAVDSRCRARWRQKSKLSDCRARRRQTSGCRSRRRQTSCCRSRRRQMSGPLTAEIKIVRLSGLSTADVGLKACECHSH